ncbi:hypothetical protein WMY93_032740, partial [Mugilogobius chulae]
FLSKPVVGTYSTPDCKQCVCLALRGLGVSTQQDHELDVCPVSLGLPEDVCSFDLTVSARAATTVRVAQIKRCDLK